MAIITTSRGASKKTLKLAKSLSLLIPDSIFERRGKKNIEKLVEIGRKKGHSRIVILSEEGGEPARLSFISLDETKWSWLPVEFEILEFKVSKHLLPAETAYGKDELAELFEFEPEEGDVLIEEKRNKLMFKRDGKALLELEVKKLGVKA